MVLLPLIRLTTGKKVNGKYLYYSYLEDYLGIDKLAKMSLACETNLINNALDNGLSWASIHTIPNHVISRQTISTKIKSINYNYFETPKILCIEVDEVHANLQSRIPGNKNKIIPVILT